MTSELDGILIGYLNSAEEEVEQLRAELTQIKAELHKKRGRGGRRVSTTDKPAHRPAADPGAPRTATLPLKVSPADKAVYDALSPERKAAARDAMLAALRAAIGE